MRSSHRRATPTAYGRRRTSLDRQRRPWLGSVHRGFLECVSSWLKFGSKQSAFPTGRAAVDVDVEQFLEPLRNGEPGSRGRVGGLAQEHTTPAEVLGLAPAGKKTVVAYPHETVGKDVEQEACDECMCIEGFGALLVVMASVTKADGNLIAAYVNDTVIRDRHSVCVPAEVVEDRLWTCKRPFGVDHPVYCAEALDEVGEALRSAVDCVISWGIQLALGPSPLQRVDELSAKDPAQGAHRKEKRRAAGDPMFTMIGQGA